MTKTTRLRLRVLGFSMLAVGVVLTSIGYLQSNRHWQESTAIRERARYHRDEESALSNEARQLRRLVQIGEIEETQELPAYIQDLETRAEVARQRVDEYYDQVAARHGTARPWHILQSLAPLLAMVGVWIVAAANRRTTRQSQLLKTQA